MRSAIVVTPRDLVKRLVGDRFQVEVKLNPKYTYVVELVEAGIKEEKVLKFEKVKAGYLLDMLLTESGNFAYLIRYRRVGQKRFRFIKNEKGGDLKLKVQVDPAWLYQAIVYCVFVRFFKGKVLETPVEAKPAVLSATTATDTLADKVVGPITGMLPGDGGTFDDVKAHLKTLKKMHINVLYFNPIHTIGEIYRGYNLMDQLAPYLQPGSPYSVKDYKAIDPELAYDKDKKSLWLSDPQREFLDLVKAAHEQGMLVVMDLVFNHTAHDFAYQRIHPDWYLYKQNITNLDEPYLYPEDVKQGLPWGDARHSVPPYDHGNFWEDCAQLNWEYRLTPAQNEPPPNYHKKEMWDFFKAIPQYWINHFGIDGFRCDVAYRVPPRFWQECISEARQMAKQVKTNLTHDVIFVAEAYSEDLELLQGCGFSAVYGDFSHKLSRPEVLKGYLDYIYNVTGNFFPDGSRWFHFPDSHDFDRTPRKVIPDPVIDSERALKANISRWVLTATLPGIPLIFNGFEKIEWQPINIWSYGAIDWQREVDLQTYIAKVNQIRRHSPALEKGNYQYLETNQGLDNKTQLFAFLREYGSDRRLVVVNMDVNQPAGPAIVFLPKQFNREYELLDELTGQQYKRSGQELTVSLLPGQSHIFRVLI